MNELVIKHRKRLMELDAKGNDIILGEILPLFSNDRKGQVMFSLVIAKTIKAICSSTPGLHPETFIEDVMKGTALWVDCGEPTTSEVTE